MFSMPTSCSFQIICLCIHAHWVIQIGPLQLNDHATFIYRLMLLNIYVYFPSLDSENVFV